MDEAAWEQAHQDAYGEEAWPRVRRLAWLLAKRRIGYSPEDLEQIEAGEDDPQARQDRASRWLPASQVLALALWRAARHGEVLVDDVEFTHAFWWLGGERTPLLFAEPLPEWVLAGNWRTVQQRREHLIATAREVGTWHIHAHITETRPLRDTNDGTPDQSPPILLGDRCRAVAAGPFRDGQPPRWKAAVDHARHEIEWARDELQAKLWTPGPAARQAAQTLHPTLVATPDSPPPLKGVQGVMWIQRVVHLGHVHDVIRAVLEHHRGEAELAADPACPAGAVLSAVLVPLIDALPAVRDLEQVWDQRPEGRGVAEWERMHLPVPVREHVLALEELLHQAAGLTASLAGLG